MALIVPKAQAIESERCLIEAGDIMQLQPITATPEMAIDDAVHRMVVHRISGLPVVDPSGVLTQSNLSGA